MQVQQGVGSSSGGGTSDVNIVDVGGNPVTTTVPVSGTVSSKLQDGSGNAITSTAGRLDVNLPAGGSGLTDTELRASTVPVSGTFFQATQPVSGTFFQATQPISAASLPLPTGASTLTEQQTQTGHLDTITSYTPVAGLSFRETILTAATYTTAWVATDGMGWLRIQNEIPTTAAILGTVETSTATDPANPTADDIVQITTATLAGAGLGGLDKSTFSLPSGAKWTRIKATNLTGSSHEVKVKTDFTSITPSGAHLPLISGLQTSYNAPITRSIIAAFERGNGTSHNAEADEDGNIYVRSVPNRASQAPGRTRFQAVGTHITANTTLQAAPGAGFRLVVTNYNLSSFNASTIAMGQLHLRQTDATGTVIAPHSLPTAIAGASAPILSLAPNMTEPLILAENTSLFLHFAAGTITASIVVAGYIESTA